MLCRAQVLYKVAPVEEKPLIWENVPLPQIQENDLLVKVLACGICLTDRQIIEGQVPVSRLPLILGHQVVGTVIDKGVKVKNFSQGDRVGIPWLSHTCGHCYYCKIASENLCENAAFTGKDVNGGYSEYCKVDHDYAIKLSKDTSPEETAPLLCAGIVGYRSYKLSKIKPGEHLGIFGFGSAGHIVIQIARFHGCKVSVFTRAKEHQKEAEKLGASFVGTSEERPAYPLDSAIIFAPSGPLVHPALKYLRRGGTIAFNAIHASPIPAIDYSLIYYEKSLLSIANATRQDGTEFFALAKQANIKTDIVCYPLEKANEAHYDLKFGNISQSAVLIM